MTGDERDTINRGRGTRTRWSVVGKQAVDVLLAVCLGGQAVAAGLVEAGVSEEFGDEDKAVALADEAGSEGVVEDVRGELLNRGPTPPYSAADSAHLFKPERVQSGPQASR